MLVGMEIVRHDDDASQECFENTLNRGVKDHALFLTAEVYPVYLL
jgi:hypothetical protein